MNSNNYTNMIIIEEQYNELLLESLFNKKYMGKLHNLNLDSKDKLIHEFKKGFETTQYGLEITNLAIQYIINNKSKDIIDPMIQNIQGWIINATSKLLYTETYQVYNRLSVLYKKYKSDNIKNILTILEEYFNENKLSYNDRLHVRVKLSEIISDYSEFIKWITTYKITTSTYPFSFAINFLGYSEKDIINYCLNNKDHMKYFNTINQIKNMFNSDSDLGFREIKNFDMINFNQGIIILCYDGGGYSLILEIQNKKLFEIFDDGAEVLKCREFSRFKKRNYSNINKNDIITVDAYLGYYLMSKPPKGINGKNIDLKL